MRNLLTVISLCLVVALGAYADRTRSTKSVKVRPELVAPPAAKLDTIVNPSGAMIEVSGYDKTLRSRRETFLLTNALADTLVGIEFTILYTDLQGRELHRRTHTLTCRQAPGSTVCHNIPSWDYQQSYYYRLSAAPKRARGVPYDVKFTILRAFTTHGSDSR